MKRLLLILTIAAIAAARVRPGADAVEAHRYADGVLLPRLTAALNDWCYQHPQDAPGKEGQHTHTLNAGDVERYRAVRKAVREWDEAMKRAGY